MIRPILAAALLGFAVPAAAEPLLPADRTAVDLVKAHQTGGYLSVARTIAYAERASGGAFVFAGYRVERRPEEPYVRVRICYRLGSDPAACGVEYLVSTGPAHVEPADRYIGLGRDIEHGPRAFLRALAREASLQRQPELLRRVQAAFETYNPYDWH